MFAFVEKYGAFAIAAVCLISVITSWGNNGILTGILIAGAIICPFIGLSNLKDGKERNR
ncbi:hypothetical protein [Planococcus wigleyi]|uniref:Uncharacterized protein n=1 Tax=Planococcus wigleyi TaxID=2762216 RepID=A0ABR8WET7_9BACL|nr:hypothetical protein [Planococcus wigleyi]MBD8015556.1 hypothetical protein [Planococcus wigleyi]